MSQGGEKYEEIYEKSSGAFTAGGYDVKHDSLRWRKG